MQNSFRYIAFSLTLLMMAGSESDAAQPSVSILINQQALITGHDVLLGNIAFIESSDETLADRLRTMHICPAAKPDLSRMLHIGYIKSRVRQQGILPESINWSGADQVVAKTKAQYLSPQEILSYAEEYVRKQRAVNGEKQEMESQALQPSRMKIQPLSKIRQAILPCGEVAVKVEQISSASRNEVIPLKLTISVDGRDCEKRIISFRVVTLREVLITLRFLSKHKVIEEGDLSLALREISNSLAGASVFLKEEELIGKRARRGLREGTIITENMVEQTPVVNPGDLVTIIIESPAFRITTQGKVREAGARGGMIRVINISSMKEIIAEVVSGKIVRVPFLKHG